MIITVLECNPDGTQTLQQCEVPDTYFDQPEPDVQPPTEMEQLRADMDFIAIMTGVEL